MKKILFSFVLSVLGIVAANAAQVKYTGVLIDNGDQITRYLFTAKPSVKYETVGGVTSANFYIEGEASPVVSVPMQSGNKLKVSYDSWIIAKLNTAGFATFSAASDSYIATDGVKAYKAKLSGSDIILTELNGNIPAGNGVLLYGGSSMAGTSVDLPVATEGDAADMTNNNLEATTHADGSLAVKPSNSWSLSSDNQFKPYIATEFIHNRAYLIYDNSAPITSAKSLRMIFADDDETTGVENTVSAQSLNGKFLENGKVVIVKNGKKYNIGGQKLSR